MISVFVPMWGIYYTQVILLIHQQYDLCVVGEKMDHHDYSSQIILYHFLSSGIITNLLSCEHVKWFKLYLYLMYFYLHFIFIKIIRKVCTPPFLLAGEVGGVGGRGGLILLPNCLKNEGLDSNSIFRGYLLGKMRWHFFREDEVSK